MPSLRAYLDSFRVFFAEPARRAKRSSLEPRASSLRIGALLLSVFPPSCFAACVITHGASQNVVIPIALDAGKAVLLDVAGILLHTGQPVPRQVNTRS